MSDATSRVEWLVRSCPPSRVIWDAERLLFVSTSDGFRQWITISGVWAIEKVHAIFSMEKIVLQLVTLFVKLKLTTPF